jgi:hypothetical protein
LAESKIWPEQWHEDGRAISCGFEERQSFSSSVFFSTTSFRPARHLCPG